jgi:hypothetical protein
MTPGPLDTRVSRLVMPLGAWLLQLGIATYGGYFGGGMGIMVWPRCRSAG